MKILRSENEIFKTILNQLDQFLEGKERQDDITILGIEYSETNTNGK